MESAENSSSDRNAEGALRKILIYVPKLASFALQRFVAARWVLVLAVVGVGLEYATLTVMLPLSVSSGRGAGTRVTDAWRSVAHAVGLPDGTRTWLWIFVLLLGIRIATGFVQVSLNSYVAKKIMAFLCGGAFSRVVVDEPLAVIYQRSVGHYLAMAGDEALRVGQIYFNLVQVLSSVFGAVIGLLVLYLFSPLALTLTGLFLLLAALSLVAMLGRVIKMGGESTRWSRQVATIFVEAINGVRSIRSMGGEDFVVNRFVESITGFTRALYWLDVLTHASKAVPALCLTLIGLVVLFPGAGFFGDASALFLFAVIAMVMRVLGFFGTAVTSGGRLVLDIRVAFDLGEILGQPAEPTGIQRGANPSGPTPGALDIVFSDLICGYENNPAVLAGISGHLAAGRCYALVGRSGTGKSTLADVLLGLLTPSMGELRFNNVSYGAVSMNSLRRRVVLVEQQTRIFSGTLRENIEFGLSSDAAVVQKAVLAAGLSEFVESLPDGLETQLDYQGANLSGGQRQRIGLARAIVRQPDVLILDEATSALDAQTRDVVLGHLREIFTGGILFFITHDSEVIKLADEIWHIKKGKLTIEMRDSKLRPLAARGE